jgi:hypothetical protein
VGGGGLVAGVGCFLVLIGVAVVVVLSGVIVLSAITLLSSIAFFATILLTSAVIVLSTVLLTSAVNVLSTITRASFILIPWALDTVVVLATSLFVRHTTLALGLPHGRRDIQPIIVPQVVEPNIPLRIIHSRRNKGLHDTMTATTDTVVLELHDGPGTKGAIALEISSEGRHGGHQDDDLEELVGLVGADDAVDYGAADLVLDWFLSV